ncbi:hypothetical protein FB567DRAFT_278380 [Paraphoma chrysanthemicola]|uniref:Integral membrane protein n=1 Tax=Paraphoma chrysanthemicola TaxID=798071 RepID=A0A8K0RAU4_9PLEO|nr:hypothetical protein FB567DRAFT_278380 [Paraphoma chrysanthemicola]
MHAPARPITGFLVLVAIAILYTITSVSSRDPTSIFFRARKGYEPRYSNIRRQQAEAFIANHTDGRTPDITKSSHDEKKRKLCVGIPSTKRKGAEYLPTAVGSLLEGLTPEEREEIYIIVFIPHSRPEVHQVYNEKWLPELVDQVITYEFGVDRMQYIVNMEREGSRLVEKSLFDYAYLLNKCAETFIPHVAIFEDDTLAMDGWYHRVMAGIHDAEQQAALHHKRTSFLYLRLFYTEGFLGWNKRNWPLYLWRSICVAAVPTAALVFIRVFQPRTKLSMTLTTTRAFLTLYAGLAVLILFYFSIGHLTVAPIPSGVASWSRTGCCSQAFVFPNLKAQDLVTYFKERHIGYPDVLADEFANDRNELTFTMTPSVVQHVGRQKAESRWGRGGGEKVWNFAYERLDAATLRREHEEVSRAKSETS